MIFPWVILVYRMYKEFSLHINIRYNIWPTFTGWQTAMNIHRCKIDIYKSSLVGRSGINVKIFRQVVIK